jgi:nitrate/nitrite transporter NarK
MNRSFIKGFYGVVAGYLLFAVSTVLLFKISDVDPGNASISFRIYSSIYGSIFALLGGFTSAVIAGRREVFHAAIVGTLLFVVATISLITAPGDHWSQWVTILIFVPLSIAGGYIQTRRRTSK